MVKDHWRQFTPQRFNQLSQAGNLEEAIQTAVRLTLTTVTALVHRGMDPWEAWTSIREEWALLPQEEPELTATEDVFDVDGLLEVE
jgi:hypothetical protein